MVVISVNKKYFNRMVPKRLGQFYPAEPGTHYYNSRFFIHKETAVMPVRYNSRMF
jgi:hypothetical protein